MAQLRVRSGADIALADALGAPGCPLCRERRRTEAAYLESILAESVNDIPYRQALDEARGYCRRHARAFLDADRARSGTLGASILLRATLVARLRDVEAAAAAKGWSRARRVADARRPPACPACEREVSADGRSVETVVRMSEDAGWAEAASGAPFCLDHVLALMDVRGAPAAWAAVEARQVERLRQLRDRLERFAHASAHDRRHLQTDDQRAAVDEAADLLAGPRPPVSPMQAAAGFAATTVAPVAPDATDDQAVDDARAVLLNGVYGAGKTTVAAELAEQLSDSGVHCAAIDLDWLGWHAAPVDWDEHEDPRLTLENLAAVTAVYRAAGVDRFVLALRVGQGIAPRIAAAMGMPVTVVGLGVTPDIVRERLAGDPTAARAADLQAALQELADGGAPPSDWSVDAARPVADVATEIGRRLGWLPD